jgi:sugar transferase (PEP-CTERM/EpsH1 system associated)
MHLVYALRPGGMELGVVKIANGLDQARVHCSICSTRSAGDLKTALAPHIRLFELAGRNGNDVKLVWDLYRLFVAERPDIVHTHSWGTLLEGLLAARLARVPVVIHGEHGTLQLRPYQRWLQRQAWRAADQVIAVSSRLADRIARETAFPRESIRVLRNGVDLARFDQIDRSAVRRSLSVPAEAQVVVAVGRLVPVKDHRMLLEAIAMMCRNQVPVTLLIAGDGPLKEPLQAQAAALGIGAHVRFLGHRPDAEAVLAAADVFVLSSSSEGMSNTILEAMAARLPVVATRVGGADEMVIDGETGCLVPAGGPEELAAALTALLSAPDRARAMGAAGRARAEQEFSLSGMVTRYETLYAEAVSVKAARRVSANSVGPAAQRSKVG